MTMEMVKRIAWAIVFAALIYWGWHLFFSSKIV